MIHPFLMVWLLLMIRFEFVYVYFIATKNVGDYSYMSSPNIYYRAQKNWGNTEYRPSKNYTVYCLVTSILHNFIPIINYMTKKLNCRL